MIWDLLAMIIISSITILLLVTTLLQRKSKIDILNKYVQSEIEKAAVLEKLTEVLKENEAKTIEESDGFLKFISDSRDWAFRYIEEVQNTLHNFDKEISPILDYADKYGILDIDTPSKDSIIKISKAYKELRKVLPQDMVE